MRVSTTIDARPRAVWEAIRDIGSHVEWMGDAVAIRFTSRRREGVGTTFECDTRVGPFTTVDRMEITEWRPGRVMGVRHVGLVRGEGRFLLRGRWRGGTRFVWEEELRFPWWLAGPAGARLAAPVLARIWLRNLRALKHRVEAAQGH